MVASDAEWCGQCYEPLRSARLPQGTEAEAGSSASATGSTRGGRGPAGIEIEAGRASWTCATCGERNAIEAATCAACGTPFTRLLEEPADRPAIEPQTAAVWSLAWPGLGHWRAGYRADGVARIVLFAWTFGTLVVLIVSRLGKGGLGATLPLFVAFLISAAAVYVVSAIDAYRLAGGDRPLVSSRVLLWASALLVVVSAVLASFVTLPAARR